MNSSPDMTPRQRSDWVKHLARLAGFAARGICSADPIERKEYVLEWLRAGRHGGMEYLQRNIDVRLDPGLLLPGARSVIVVGWLYRVKEDDEGLPAAMAPDDVDGGGNDTALDGLHTEPVMTDTPSQSKAASQPPHSIFHARLGPEPRTLNPQMASHGRIARYAWGRDYHRVIRKRLQRLVDQLRATVADSFDSRVCVDTTPLLERELAQRAGVGWIGNNCLVLSRELGSYFCLGAVVTTLDLAPDAPTGDLCGTCRRCLEACPTGALIAPKQMDARRCISYQTIENRDKSLVCERPELAGQIFGCDICQQVCPYNGPGASVSLDPDAQPRWPAGRIDLAEVLSWTPADWDIATQGRSLRRAILEMWRRNAEVVLHQR